MTARSSPRWLGLDVGWPPALRVVAGGAAGWAAARWGVTEPVPGWGRLAVAGVAALGALAAPAVTRMATTPVVAGWAVASVLGLYYGVPETDHVVGVAAMVAVLALVSFTVAPRPSWVLVAGLDVVLPWAALRGTPAGGPALVAGLAVPGLLLLAPLVRYVPGPRSPLAPRAVRSVVLVALQLVFAALVARQAATSDTIATSAAVAALAAIGLVVAARFAAGPL